MSYLNNGASVLIPVIHIQPKQKKSSMFAKKIHKLVETPIAADELNGKSAKVLFIII